MYIHSIDVLLKSACFNTCSQYVYLPGGLKDRLAESCRSPTSPMYMVQWDRMDMLGPSDTWDSRGQSHLSYMVQWDRTDRWDMVGSDGTWDYHGQSHLSYMVQWDRADRWDGGPRWYVGFPWTVSPVLHGTVG